MQFARSLATTMFRTGTRPRNRSSSLRPLSLLTMPGMSMWRIRSVTGSAWSTPRASIPRWPAPRTGGSAWTAARLARTYGLALDSEGHLYVTGSGNHGVPRIDAVTRNTETVAGAGEAGFSRDGGPASDAQLSWPEDVALDPDGNVLVTDRPNHRFRRMKILTGVIETILTIDHPAALAVDNAGNLFIGAGHRILSVGPDGTTSLVAGSGIGGLSGDKKPATGAEVSVSAIAMDSEGVIWFTDQLSRRSRVLGDWDFRNQATGNHRPASSPWPAMACSASTRLAGRRRQTGPARFTLLVGNAELFPIRSWIQVARFRRRDGHGLRSRSAYETCSGELPAGLLRHWVNVSAWRAAHGHAAAPAPAEAFVSHLATRAEAGASASTINDRSVADLVDPAGSQRGQGLSGNVSHRNSRPGP